MEKNHRIFFHCETTRYGKWRREDRKKLKRPKLNDSSNRIVLPALISFGDRDQSRDGEEEKRSENLLHTPSWSIVGEIKAKLRRHLTDSRSSGSLVFFDWATFLTATGWKSGEKQDENSVDWIAGRNRVTINGKGGTSKTNSESRTFDTPGIKTGEIKIFSFFFYDRRWVVTRGIYIYTFLKRWSYLSL